MEQNNASPQVVIDKVLGLSYKNLFLQVCIVPDTSGCYEGIGRSFAAYERSKEVSQFTSNYDYWLKGQAMLTGQLWPHGHQVATCGKSCALVSYGLYA